MSDTFDHGWDAFEDLLGRMEWEEPGEDRYRPSPAKSKTCRACGKAGLRWGNVTGGRWRLFDGNSEHKCDFTPPRYP